jgi:gamma-glutamyltranspeptidase/glutathione hydrolase
VRDDLQRRGHQIDLQGEFSNMMGGGQAVLHDARAAVNYGASDPRKDGAAIPEPILD